MRVIVNNSPFTEQDIRARVGEVQEFVYNERLDLVWRKIEIENIVSEIRLVPGTPEEVVYGDDIMVTRDKFENLHRNYEETGVHLERARDLWSVVERFIREPSRANLDRVINVYIDLRAHLEGCSEEDRKYIEAVGTIINEREHRFTPAGMFFRNTQSIELYYEVWNQNDLMTSLKKVLSHELFHAIHCYYAGDNFADNNWKAKIVKEASAEMFAVGVYFLCLNWSNEFQRWSREYYGSSPYAKVLCYFWDEIRDVPRDYFQIDETVVKKALRGLCLVTQRSHSSGMDSAYKFLASKCRKIHRHIAVNAHAIRRISFRDWLTNEGLDKRVVSDICSRVNRVKALYDLDAAFNAGDTNNVLDLFSYSRQDESNGLRPRHAVAINGNNYTGTLGLKNAIKRYFEYLSIQ